MDPDRGRDVVHGELVAGLVDLVLRRHRAAMAQPRRAGEPVEREPLHALRGLLVADDEGAALERGDVLRGMERERGQVPVRADRPARPAGADRVRGVLDDEQPMTVAQLVDAIEVDRVPGEVHGHQRARPRADQRLGVVEVDQAGARVGVDEHRDAAVVDHGVGARHERDRGKQHLVALLDAADPQRERQAGGAGGEAADVPNTDVRGEPLLERRDLRPHREPPAPDRVEQLGDLLVADRRPAQAEVDFSPGALVHRIQCHR